MEWFEETLYPNIGQRFQVTKVVFREKTEHQDLVIFETPVLGRVLALDGVIQVTEGDEYVYHEMLTHVPLVAHGRARRTLIVHTGTIRSSRLKWAGSSSTSSVNAVSHSKPCAASSALKSAAVSCG